MGVMRLGIDDAGRGPVIGPMVLAGCLIDDKIEAEFRRLGVKDSKQLTQKRRECFEKIIKEKSLGFKIIMISPEEIDQKNKEGLKLNELEALAAAKIINRLNTGEKKMRVILDCPSTSILKWGDFLKTKINNLSNIEMVCEHKADRNHVSVSAASILAKSAREREIKKLKEKYGEGMGSGYPSDPTTKKFLENHGKKHKNKGIFRKSWKTWKKAHPNEKQKKLF
jgi:ribonuclease HII